jgi:xylulokinase
MYYVGLDVGTSSLKTTVMDQNQKIQYENSYDYSVDEPAEGYREIDPSVWFDACIQGLKDILDTYDEADVKAIGVTGQMHSAVFLDENGGVVRPTIMWNDLRTADMVDSIKEELANIEETKYIARIISTGSPAMNILWIKENEPDSFRKIKKIMTPYDYIVFRLTGKYSCDYCDAATSSLFDIVSKQWSSYMLDKLGINESFVGPLHGSGEVIGPICKDICQSLGISHDILVIAGTGDNPATAISMGILDQSDPVISLGTSGVVILPKKDGDFEGKGKNVLFSADGDHFVNIVQSTVQSAGGTHRWWVKKIVQTNDYQIDQDKISENDLGNNSVMMFPHITGDKYIYADPYIRGAFIGLSMNTSRKDMTQAMFEGISFALRDVLDNMQLKEWPTQICVNGGAAKYNPIWMKILANILNTKIKVVTMDATPGYGICLLAQKALSQAYNQPKRDAGIIYMPQKEIVDRYEIHYQKYKKLYHVLKEVE